jgi:hypothetical protein
MDILQTFYLRLPSISKPLTNVTDEKQAFHWTQKWRPPFQILKDALCTAPILAYPQPRERFIVHIHIIGIAGMLP